MVPLVRIGFGTSIKMQGSWNDDNNKTLEVVVESCKGMDDEPILKVKGSSQYHHKWDHWHPWHLKIRKK